MGTIQYHAFSTLPIQIQQQYALNGTKPISETLISITNDKMELENQPQVYSKTQTQGRGVWDGESRVKNTSGK